MELAVVARGTAVARLVLLAGPDTPASLDQRVVAVALADQLGAAMAAAAPGGDRRLARSGTRRSSVRTCQCVVAVAHAR